MERAGSTLPLSELINGKASRLTAPLTRLIAINQLLRNGADKRVRHVRDAENDSFEATERAPTNSSDVFRRPL